MRRLFSIMILLIVMGTLFCQDKAQQAKKTEVWEPVPPVVTPGENNAPPSDALVLFDGTDLSGWVDKEGNPAKWVLEDGAMTVAEKAGPIYSREKFADCQLHIEFRIPVEDKGEGQGKGNSGVFLQNRYEVQVLDSYENKTYVNGQCGAIYKQHIPLVNACLPPGEWQTYNIFFTAPRFNDDKSLKSPGYITVVHNGVLIHNHVELQGPSVWIGKPKYEYHEMLQPIMLQDHGHPVSYRNIWVRRLE